MLQYASMLTGGGMALYTLKTIAFKAGYTASMLATGAAASYASTQATALAASLGVSEDYIRIGADALQVVTMWKLAKAQRRGDACFVAGTQVITGVGSNGEFLTKSIEDIAVGDIVLSRDQHDVGDDLDPRRVTSVFRKTSNHVRVLTFRDGDGNVETIRTTDEHPFYVNGTGWTEADELSAGMRISEADGTDVVFVSSIRESHPQGITVFNFEVEGDHTYFVEDGNGKQDAIWVHNNCGFRQSVLDKWSKKIGKKIAGAFEAHHVVPINHPAAARLRNVLAQLDIDINSPTNGVPLLPNYHRRQIHMDTDAYVDAIEPRILAKVSQGKEAVESELESIGEGLFDNVFTIPD